VAFWKVFLLRELDRKDEAAVKKHIVGKFQANSSQKRKEQTKVSIKSD
jgi:hypothetical protein